MVGSRKASECQLLKTSWGKNPVALVSSLQASHTHLIQQAPLIFLSSALNLPSFCFVGGPMLDINYEEGCCFSCPDLISQDHLAGLSWKQTKEFFSSNATSQSKGANGWLSSAYKTIYLPLLHKRSEPRCLLPKHYNLFSWQMCIVFSSKRFRLLLRKRPIIQRPKRKPVDLSFLWSQDPNGCFLYSSQSLAVFFYLLLFRFSRELTHTK